jgi:hypothetical protein
MFRPDYPEHPGRGKKNMQSKLNIIYFFLNQVQYFQTMCEKLEAFEMMFCYRSQIVSP